MTLRMSFLFAIGLSITCPLAWPQSQRPWQNLRDTSWQEAHLAWNQPPAEYGPEPYYGLNGPITIEVVKHDFDTMQSLGFRAVTVQYGAGSDRDYLSPAYLSFFRQVVLEAKSRGMRVWIVDDAGYPSGFAGGKFTLEHPELRMQALVSTRQALTSGEAFDRDVSTDTVAVTAIRSSDGETISIPILNGHVHWAPPENGWTVYLVEHAFRTSPTRSDTNPKRVKDTTQSLEDYLDPTATAQYLAFTHEAHQRAVGDEFGKTVLGFRGDEPDYSISGLPWTPKFFAAFASKKGYDVKPYVASFLQGKDAVLTPLQQRIRADYYDVFADLFRDGFFKPQADWFAAHGLEYQVHLNHEEQQLALARSEGDFFRDMRFVQIPGIDTIWHQISTDTVSDFPRLASSAAHVYGHPRAFTESFAAYRPLPDVAMARYILNEQFVRGINLVETMYFPASTGGKGGPMAFMRDPQYPTLMQYTSRMSYLMSQGRPMAQVALLLPSSSLWLGDAKADDAFVSTERLLSEHQVDFDVVDEDAIASLLSLVQGAFKSGSGNGYRTVLVPHASLLPQAVVDRLRRFAEEGGKVLFLDGPPSRLSGNSSRDAREVPASDFGWAVSVAANLPVTPTPPAYPPATPPEPMPVSAELINAVFANIPSQSLTVTNANAALRFTSRRLKDATIFLLFNESAQSIENSLEFHVSGRHVEQWDAQTGAVSPVASHAIGHGRAVSLHLAPYATEILVVH